MPSCICRMHDPNILPSPSYISFCIVGNAKQSKCGMLCPRGPKFGKYLLQGLLLPFAKQFLSSQILLRPLRTHTFLYRSCPTQNLGLRSFWKFLQSFEVYCKGFSSVNSLYESLQWVLLLWDGNCFCEFTVRVYCESLLWEFTSRVYCESLLWEVTVRVYSVRVSCESLLWGFSVSVYCESLLWGFTVRV